jgi:hypothetical protein
MPVKVKGGKKAKKVEEEWEDVDEEELDEESDGGVSLEEDGSLSEEEEVEDLQVWTSQVQEK